MLINGNTSVRLGGIYEEICPGSILVKRGPRFVGIPSPQQISAKKLCVYMRKKMSRQNEISALINRKALPG